MYILSSAYLASYEFCTSLTSRKFSCASSLDTWWFTRHVSYPIEPSYCAMMLVAFLKRSKKSWFVSNFRCLHWKTDTQASYITWVSSLLPSNLNTTPLTSFSIPIMYWSHSMDSYLLSPLILKRIISVHFPWRIVDALFRFSPRISSLSTFYYFSLQNSFLDHS